MIFRPRESARPTAYPRSCPPAIPTFGRKANARTRSGKKRDVHGWIVLDKPVGMTSTHAVAVIKRLFAAKRAGHAGTLDPLASGLSADRARRSDQDRSVPDRRPQDLSLHRRWGEERDTDDAEGRVVDTSESRPDGGGDPGAAAALRRHDRAGPAALFGGEDRRRARLRPGPRGRNGRTRAARGRPSIGSIWSRRRIRIMPCSTAECGKGTYVRALARDLGRALGAFGHV